MTGSETTSPETSPETLSNYPYEALTIGQTATYSKVIEEQDVQLFAAVSGDVNRRLCEQAMGEVWEGFRGRG